MCIVPCLFLFAYNNYNNVCVNLGTTHYCSRVERHLYLFLAFLVWGLILKKRNDAISFYYRNIVSCLHLFAYNSYNDVCVNVEVFVWVYICVSTCVDMDI